MRTHLPPGTLPGPGATLVRHLVAFATGTADRALLAPSRSQAPIARARQIAMYLCHVILCMSHVEVGRHFGRDRTTAAHACKVVEDWRDDPVFDAWLERIEAVLVAVPRPEAAPDLSGAAL